MTGRAVDYLPQLPNSVRWIPRMINEYDLFLLSTTSSKGTTLLEPFQPLKESTAMVEILFLPQHLVVNFRVLFKLQTPFW